MVKNIHPDQSLVRVLSKFPSPGLQHLSLGALDRIKVVSPAFLARTGKPNDKLAEAMAKHQSISSINDPELPPFIWLKGMLIPNKFFQEELPSILSVAPSILNDPTNHWIWYGNCSSWGYLNRPGQAPVWANPRPMVTIGRKLHYLPTLLMTPLFRSHCPCNNKLCLNPAHWGVDQAQLLKLRDKISLIPLNPQFQLQVNDVRPE